MPEGNSLEGLPAEVPAGQWDVAERQGLSWHWDQVLGVGVVPPKISGTAGRGVASKEAARPKAPNTWPEGWSTDPGTSAPTLVLAFWGLVWQRPG